MDSVQTLIWLSGTPIGRVMEHTDEEWLTAIGRQIRAEEEREKKWLDKRRKEYDDWTKKYESYLKWCKDSNKKPSALNHLKYKFRNKSEKGKELSQREQTEKSERAGGATSDKSKPATEPLLTETVQSHQNMKDEKPETSAQSINADAATSIAGVPKGQPDDAQETVKTDSDEVKATPLTLEQEIEELKKQIAILTIKIGDGAKET